MKEFHFREVSGLQGAAFVKHKHIHIYFENILSTFKKTCFKAPPSMAASAFSQGGVHYMGIC